MTDPRQSDIIRKYLHAIDLCMTDEGIDGHTRRRVLNRFCWGHPDGNPDVQIAVMVDQPATDQPTWHEFYNRYVWPAGQDTAGMSPESASTGPTPTPEGQDSATALTDALKATGIKVEDIDPTALREALVQASGPAWGEGRGGYLAGLLGAKFQEDAARRAADLNHTCGERCVCPIHGTPLLYAPAQDEHACQDPDCKHAHGIVEPDGW